MAEIPEEIKERLQHHLTAIARLFKAPKITLIVRGPEAGNAKGDLVLGNDSPTLALAALRARIIAEAEFLAGDAGPMLVQRKEPGHAAHTFHCDEITPATSPSGKNFKRAENASS